MTPTQTPGLYEEDRFVVEVREYILSTLVPFLPQGDSTSKFLLNLLRRALRSATREDLEQVVLHCVGFTDGLRAQGFITDELARQADAYLSHTQDLSPLDWDEVSGPGTPDWSDSLGEVNPSQVPDNELLPGDGGGGEDEGLRETESLGSGHEAEMAGDESDEWTISDESVQEDGARG